MSFRISTVEYEVAHGRLPRGKGCWCFYLKRMGEQWDPWCSGNVTYSEAKKKAVEYYRSKGYDTSLIVYLGS